MMAAVVIGSYLLMLVGQPSGMQFLVALGVAIIMIPLAFALGEIMTTLKKNKVKADLDGVKQIGMAMLVIIKVNKLMLREVDPNCILFSYLYLSLNMLYASYSIH